MDNQKIAQLIPQAKDILQGADNVGIIVTEFQSLDKVGAGLALYLALQEAGKNVQIVSRKDPLVEISNLVGIDKLSRSFEGITKKLVVSLPYYEGEVEKVSYNIEGNRLNINLFAAKDKGISFKEKDVDFIRSGSNPSVLVTIGIRKEEEMAGLVSPDAQVKMIRLDTVVPQQNFGEVTIADPDFSSISEIVTMLIRELNLPIDADTAQNLLDGVVFATNNFSAPNTSSAAFASAAYLLAHGAQRKNIPVQSRSGEQRKPRQESVKVAQEQQSVPMEEVSPPQTNNTTEIVQEAMPEQKRTEEVPSDWFVPKVFKSSKVQE